MQHIAIMKKEWGLIDRILSGEKVLETRWYKNRYAPWNKVKKGDYLYFKNPGGKVSVKATVVKVEQFEVGDENIRNSIVKSVWEKDLGKNGKKEILIDYARDKRYCIIIWFTKVEKICPFDINKKGFGSMSSWICIDNVDKIKI